MRQIAWAILGLLMVMGISVQPAQGQNKAKVKLRTFATPYYMMHTDLDDEGAREAWIRMTKTFEEYKRRTAGFSGDIRSKFPVFLYTQSADYFDAGAIKGSAGTYMWNSVSGGKLLINVGENLNEGTWHTMQHEAFHQFAHAVISGNLPVWVNEGMAEYFGEAFFTGDGLQTGVIPSGRLKRIQKSIKAQEFRPLREMMLMQPKEWNTAMNSANYDQAWSMVQFLAHGEEGKYQKGLVQFMNKLSAGRGYYEAWIGAFGNDVPGFQKKWEQWWLEQDERTSQRLYQKAVVAILTSHLARAVSQGQKFDTVEAFFAAAEKGELKRHREDWLPASLLQTALANYKKFGTYSLDTPKGGQPKFICKVDDELTYSGSFKLNGQRVATVVVEAVVPKSGATTRAAGK